MRKLLFGLILLLFPTSPIYSDTGDSYSFALDHVDDGTVHFRGEEGCAWKSVSYGGASFLVSADGVSSESLELDQPGLIVRLGEAGESLLFRCQAKLCSVTSTDQDTSTSIQELKQSESITVSAKARVVVTVSK